MRHAAVALVFGSALFFALPLAAQQAVSGVFRHGLSANAIAPNSSFTVVFPVTPVGSTSIQDCYYNCFVTGGGSCNYFGTISLVKSVAAPFRVINLRKAAYGDCGGTPASLPITLQAGEWLLQDFVFSPTTAGSFQDTYTYNVTPTGSPTDQSIWVLAGSTPAVAPRISFGAVPPTIRPGQSATLSWTTSGATSVIIDNGVGAQPPSGSVSVTPATTTTYTLTAMSGSVSTTAQVTVTVFTAPSLVISTVPQPILQVQNTGGGTTTYTVSNIGGTP